MTYTEDHPYFPDREDIAGVDLVGLRQDDGSITLGSGTNLPDFPKYVTVEGATYVLEDVRANEAARTPEDTRLCWGVYV